MLVPRGLGGSALAPPGGCVRRGDTPPLPVRGNRTVNPADLNWDGSRGQLAGG